MAFDGLSEKLQNVFKNLRSKGRLTEEDVKTALKEVKMALLEADVNFKVIARITAGFSGADLANLLNEAAILAAREGKSTIGNLELYEGINKVIMGPQKKRDRKSVV